MALLARVAELEDAVDLKSIVREGVWVRVPPRALRKASVQTMAPDTMAARNDPKSAQPKPPRAHRRPALRERVCAALG